MYLEPDGTFPNHLANPEASDVAEHSATVHDPTDGRRRLKLTKTSVARFIGKDRTSGSEVPQHRSMGLEIFILTLLPYCLAASAEC